jgi:transcriptional regulator with XRE-family HTH domain
MDIRKERLSQLLKLHAKNFKSQTDFAKKLDIERAAFGTYVRGASFPDTDNLQKIADYLGIELAQLRSSLEGGTFTKARETANKYQVDSQTRKAEDFILVLTDSLDNQEKIRLAKMLLEIVV